MRKRMNYNRWRGRFDQPDPFGGSYDLADPQSFSGQRHEYTGQSEVGKPAAGRY